MVVIVVFVVVDVDVVIVSVVDVEVFVVAVVNLLKWLLVLLMWMLKCFFFLMMLKCFVVDFERLPNLPYEIGKY